MRIYMNTALICAGVSRVLHVFMTTSRRCVVNNTRRNTYEITTANLETGTVTTTVLKYNNVENWR